jgi:hypothetical protein
MKEYIKRIRKFNKMYGLPINNKPTLPYFKRWLDLFDILKEEIDEGYDIEEMFEGDAEDIDILVAMADWYCDIMVYCSTQMAEMGIPTEEVMNIIMDSNFSKLDDDGNPIYDKRGKVLKGESYWKPEPKIKELFQQMANSQSVDIETINESEDDIIVRRIV